MVIKKIVIRGKRGWLRILEASIAIILILSVILVLYTKSVSVPKKADAVYNLQKTILDEIAANSELRAQIIKNDVSGALVFVAERTPVNFNSDVKICEINEICNLPQYRDNVFSSERIISSTLDKYSPKKLKIFMWSKW